MSSMHWTGKVTPVAFSIGKVSVAWYGILITIGMLISLAICVRRFKRINVKSDDVLTLFLICIPMAVIFARLGYVVSNYKYYFTSPYDWDAFVNTIAIWKGGLTVMWGVPGGVLGGYIWCKMYKVDFVKAADLVLPTVLIAQVIGRWGNFFNQELYGQPVTDPTHQWFPLAIFIADEGGWYQATFFYEGVLNFIGFVVLAYLYYHVDIKGMGTLSYPAWYCLVRGSLEFIRADEPNVVDKALGFNSVILFCYLAAAICIGLIVFLGIRAQKKGQKIFYKKGIPPLPAVPKKKTEELASL